MTDKIKKHWDLILIGGIGIIIAITGLVMSGEWVSKTSEVSAATTADVVVSATVAQTEELTISAVNAGVSVNGTTTNVTTTATTTPLGTLSLSDNTIAAHTLTMSTNAGAGYTVTTKYDHELRNLSTTTLDIDDHGGTNATPTVASGAGTEAFGYTTEDYTLGTSPTNRFSGGKWAGFGTDAYEVAYHTGPVSSTTTKIGYIAGMSILTPATTFECTVTYTMTSAF